MVGGQLIRMCTSRAPALRTIFTIFLLVVGYAKTAGYWDGNVPEHVFFELIPNAKSFAHPR